MPGFLSKRWFWITALFAAINVTGLWAIVLAVKGQRDGLDIEAFHPEGVASTRAVISLRFDQPMVVRADAGSPVADDLFDVFPPVPGRALWEDTRTVSFQPEEELRLATPYTVTVSRRFTSLLGHSLARDRIFEFHTPRLELASVRQTGRSPSAEVLLTLAFNDKVRPEEVGQRLSLRDARGNTLRYSVGGRTPSRQVGIITRPYRGKWLTVRLAKGLQGLSGPLGLSDDRIVRLKIEAGLRISRLDARASAPDNVYLRVNCTQRVNTRTAAKFIEIEPKVDFRVSSSYGGFKLLGPFVPGKRYRVKFLRGLPGAGGCFLEKDTVRAVTVPDCPPRLRFKTRGIYLSAQGTMVLPLECVNVPKVELSLEQVYANNVVHYMRDLAGRRGRYYGRSFPEDLSRTVVEHTLPIHGKRNQLHVERLDLRKLLGGARHGVFLASARDAKHSWHHDEKVIVITDLGLSVKRSETGLLVWVCALSTATPVAGARVAAFTRTNQRVLAGATDASGIAHFTSVEWSGDRAPYAVTATKDGDTGLVVLDESTLDDSELATGGRPYLRKGYEAFLYTDRGIYRPGSDVVMRAIVRGPDLTVPKPFPVHFRLTRPDGRHYKTLTARASP